MLQKQFRDKKISQLGMGNMRLPTVGERGPIDEARARALIEYAYEQGIDVPDLMRKLDEAIGKSKGKP